MSLEEIFDVMLKDKRVRLSIVKRSHKFFFYFYFSHYAEFPVAPFHEEMFHITQDRDIRSAVILGFRGCGKSTLLSLSFPLWAILGEQKIKHVLILSKTEQKARTLLQQIKYELETNELLKKDLGPFQEERNGWNLVSLYLPHYDAKITAASTEQSIRGIRHKQYRPQLILCDDLEDMDSVKTKEGRDKIYNWLIGDVIPAGGKHTRLVITGSLLHEDSVIKRLQKNIEEKNMSGIYRSYPLLDENGKCAWPGKFPDQDAIEMEKTKGITEIAWQREYLLRVIPDEGQVIYPEWIHTYDKIPDGFQRNCYDILMGVDLAISEKETADFTAIVTAVILDRDENLKIYVLPNPVNRRMNFIQTVDQIKASYEVNEKIYYRVGILVESVGFQKATVDMLEYHGLSAEAVKVTSDKRSRLVTISNLIEKGTVLFPEKGAEDLIRQLLGFGIERHDDLVDAFTIVVHKAIEENKSRFSFWFPD